jgi:hypothetical protein
MPYEYKTKYHVAIIENEVACIQGAADDENGQ